MEKCKIGIRNSSLFLCLIFALLLILWTPPAYAEEIKKTVLVVVDQITLQDLAEADLPNITAMIQEGGLGLMNTNTAGARTRGNAHVTVGAGKVALGGEESALAFNAGEIYREEPAGKIYRRRTGREAPPESLLHLGAPAILRNNEKKISAGEPGLLGETLRLAGGKTAFIGSADSDVKIFDREAAAIAMDRTGYIDFGFTGQDFLVTGTARMLPVSTNRALIIDTLKKTLGQADLVVVETGDTTRLEAHRYGTMERVYQESKRQILKETDLLIGDILKTAEKFDTLVMMITPTPCRQALQERNLLTPLIYWKKDGAAGFLTSGTTQRQGIAANTDIAPTILEYFSLPVPASMTGRPLAVIPADHKAAANASGSTLDTLLAQNRELAFINKARPPLVKGYVLAQIVAVAAAVFFFFTAGKKSRYFQPVLVALTSVPLVFLILGAISVLSFASYIFLAIVLTAAFTAVGLAGARYHCLFPFIIISLATAGAILLDIFQGAPLMQNSILGYDPMGGARYYGLGNEYMGVLVGSMVTGTACLMEVVKKKNVWYTAVAGLFLLTLFLIASPKYGANAGGSLTALLAFGFVAWKISPAPIPKRQVAWVAASTLGILAAAAFWDAGRALEVQSHFGRTINLLRTNGITEAYNIIVRKLTLNLKLIRWTVWSQVFLVTLFATTLLFYRPVGLMKKIQLRYPDLTKGFWGGVVGSLTALAVNDSGVVAAATMSIFVAAPLIFVVLRKHGDGFGV